MALEITSSPTGSSVDSDFPTGGGGGELGMGPAPAYLQVAHHARPTNLPSPSYVQTHRQSNMNPFRDRQRSPNRSLTSSNEDTNVPGAMEISNRPQVTSDLPPPAYTPPPPPTLEMLQKLVSQWEASVAASTELRETVDPEVGRLEKELEEGRKVLNGLKVVSARCFETLHTKKKSGPSFGLGFLNVGGSKAKRSKEKERARASSTVTASTNEEREGFSALERSRTAPEASAAGASTSESDLEDPVTAFERAHTSEMSQGSRVEMIEDRLSQVKAKQRELSGLALMEEERWVEVRRAIEGMNVSGEMAARIGGSIEEVERAEGAVGQARKTVKDFQRARRTIQHAHHYFSRTLEICDEIGILKNKGIFYGGKIFDYQEGIRFASMAEVCLRECLRVVEPYRESLPEVEYEGLKKYGLLELNVIYKEVFGGRLVDSSVKKTIEILLERQEKVYIYLTYLAVYIQGRVPEEEDQAKSTEINLLFHRRSMARLLFT